MTRKAALIIAAGVVAALMAGMVAFTIGQGLAGSASAAQAAMAPKPRVKTITRVITVRKHRKDKAAQPATITVVRQRQSSGYGSTSMAASSSYHGDDSYEHDTSEHDSQGGGGGDD